MPLAPERGALRGHKGGFMNRSSIAITLATALTFGATTMVAAQKGQGHGSKVKTTAVSSPKVQGGGSKAQGGPKVQAQGPKTTGGGKAVAQGSKVKTTTPGSGKATAQGPKAKATTPGGGKKTDTSTTATASSKNKKTTSTTSVATGGTSTDTVTLTPVQQKLQRNTNLASKLEGRLPAGTDLMLAAEGFRNLGQFVAAVNVSNNLGLSFTELKMRMVDDGMSLGQAIKDLRPTADTTTEVRRAETDATNLITTTETETAKKTKKGRG